MFSSDQFATLVLCVAAPRPFCPVASSPGKSDTRLARARPRQAREAAGSAGGMSGRLGANRPSRSWRNAPRRPCAAFTWVRLGVADAPFSSGRGGGTARLRPAAILLNWWTALTGLAVAPQHLSRLCIACPLGNLRRRHSHGRRSRAPASA